MIITRISPISGYINQWDLPITEEQIHEWKCGKLIQHVMPELTPDQREFFMSGITPDEWEEMFKG